MLRNKLVVVLAITNPLAWAIVAILGASALLAVAAMALVITATLAYMYWMSWESSSHGVGGDSWDSSRWSGVANDAKATPSVPKMGHGENVCASILMADAGNEGLVASGLCPSRAQNHTSVDVSPLVPTKTPAKRRRGKSLVEVVKNGPLLAVSANCTTKKSRKRKVKRAT